MVSIIEWIKFKREEVHFLVHQDYTYAKNCFRNNFLAPCSTECSNYLKDGLFSLEEQKL